MVEGRESCVYYLLIAYSHRTRTGPVPVQGPGTGLMSSSLSWRNVHIGPRQGHGPGPIVSYCSSSILCTGPVPSPMLCD